MRLLHNIFLISFLLILFFSINLRSYAVDEKGTKPLTVEPNNEATKEEDTTGKNKWTENLRLRDFYLSSEAIELKDRLRGYSDHLEKQYKEHPSVFAAAIPYGSVLIDLGEIDKAHAVWERAVKDFFSNPTPKAFKAWVDACKGDYSQAKDIWMKYAKEKLDVGVTGHSAGIWLPCHVYSVLGLHLIKNYLPDEEKVEVEKVVNEIAKHFPRKILFASILITNDLQAGRLKSAQEKIEELMESNKEDPTLVTLLGIAELLKNNYETSIQYLDEAIKIAPTQPTNHLMKARALYALKKKKEAKVEMGEAIKLDPTLGQSGKEEKLLLSNSYIISPEKSFKLKKAAK